MEKDSRVILTVSEIYPYRVGDICFIHGKINDIDVAIFCEDRWLGENSLRTEFLGEIGEALELSYKKGLEE